jgi:membrane protein implicated in regulation of membrane protease activity
MQLQLVLFVVLSLLTVLIGEREVRGVPRRAT